MRGLILPARFNPGRRMVLTGAAAVAAMAAIKAERAEAGVTTTGAGKAPSGGGGGVTLDPAFVAPNNTLSNFNLTSTVGAGGYGMIRGNKPVPAGGACCAVHFDVLATTTSALVGVLDSTNPSSGAYIGQDLKSGGVGVDASNAYKQYNNSTSGLAVPIVQGEWVMLVWLPTPKHFHIGIPGSGWDVSGGGSVIADTGGQTLASIGATTYFGATFDVATTAGTWNFGATAFHSSLAALAADCVTAGIPTLQAA